MKRLQIMLLVALALSSCDREPMGIDDSATTSQSPEATITEFYASVSPFTDGIETRTTYSDISSAGWAVGDKIGIWPDESQLPYGDPSQVIFDVVSDEDSSLVLRGNGWGLLRGRTYHAYYPYSAESGQHSVKVSYAGQHPLTNGGTSHLSGYDFMSCTWVTPDDDTLIPTFSHLGSFVQYAFTLPDALKSVPINSFTLTADAAIFATEATFDPSVDSPSLQVSSKSNSISFALGENSGISSDASGKITVNVLMAPAKWKGQKITANLTSAAGNNFYASFTPAENQSAGVISRISAYVNYDPVIDLSDGETANCYIVPKAGEYKFRAVKGNTSNEVSVKGVKILWESVGTSKAPAKNTVIKECSYSDGYIFFSTPEKFCAGNALIAAYSDAACSDGKVLWSWHLWCTPVPGNEQYKNDTGYLMDRNLGALSRTGDLSAGLFYQWGRKDPFMGTASLSSATKMASNGSFKNVSRTKSRGTINWAQANPTTFIYCASLPLDWLYTAKSNLWYVKGTKTVYDPCPPGYRVLDGSTTANTVAGRGFWAKALKVNWRLVTYSDTFESAGGNLVYSNNQLSFPLVSGNASYPATGCLTDSGGSLEYVGTNVMVWTNYPAGSDASQNWNAQFSSVLDLNMTGASPHMLYLNWNSGRAAGKNVRCMLTRSVTDVNSTDNESFGDSPIDSQW